MTFAISGAPLADYSGSALRYGLMDIKPVEVIETIKRFGLKFRRTIRTFESLKPSESYADLVTFQNEAIFSSVSIPKWFDMDKLVKAFSQHSIESYEKDAELKKVVEEARKAEGIDRPLLRLTRFFKQRFESRRDSYLELEAERFLSSNFPLSFYNKLVVFDNTYYDFLMVLENQVRFCEFRAAYSRNFAMYKKKVDEMKRVISPILDQVDNCFFSYMRLKKYVALWNSKDYKEIFYPKFLDINAVELAEYENLLNEYTTRLRETREFLLRYDPEIFRKELDTQESTTKMFSKLIVLPSGSLNLGS